MILFLFPILTSDFCLWAIHLTGDIKTQRKILILGHASELVKKNQNLDKSAYFYSIFFVTLSLLFLGFVNGTTIYSLIKTETCWSFWTSPLSFKLIYCQTLLYLASLISLNSVYSTLPVSTLVETIFSHLDYCRNLRICFPASKPVITIKAIKWNHSDLSPLL